jgi:hypothetical protein
VSVKTTLITALLASAGLALAGCAADDGTGDEEDVTETAALFGTDRISAVLKGHPELTPTDFASFEKLFKVGRQCARTDSKEIFVVEESSSRATGEQQPTDGILPRAVITGCNTDRMNPESVKLSFGLMAALVSSPDADNAAQGDPMVLTPLETMALDEKTGLYNFYVFEPNGAGQPGTLTRVMRDVNDNVITYKLTPGSKKAVKAASPTRRCFNCHVNGGPLMNELTEPWTNWVSTHKQLPQSKLSGETAAIVSEAAAANAEHHRSSLANDLEQTMRAAIRTWVNGNPKAAGSGFGQTTLDHTQPGGLGSLLKSAFCETELNYASSFDTMPMELFMDPSAVSGAGFLKPAAYPSEAFLQLPVRSEMDKRIETYLLKTGYLTARTILALRVLDDESDVFSAARCSLYADATAKLPTVPADVDAQIRKVIQAKLTAGGLPKMAAPRSKYLTALLDASVPDTGLTQLRTDYFTEAKTRFDKAAAQVTTAKGRTALKKRLADKQAAAKAMFPRAANPLPVLP